MGPKPSRAATVAAAVVLAMLVVAVGACGATAPGPTAEPRVGTFGEFFGSWCSSMQSMLRAIGNPDSGADSQLSKALDAAIEAGDLDSVEAVAGQIRTELQNGRRLAAAASAWPPGAQMASQTERVLAAFDAAIGAKQAAAKAGLAMAEELAQDAFMKAGGPEAWTGMIEAARAFPELGAADGPSCPGVG
jgi:hypothetical protein